MGDGITRRAFGVGGLAATALAASGAWRPALGSPQRITGVDISNHPVPFPDNLA